MSSRRKSARGQASAELVAVVPLLVVVALGLGQLAVAGYALWSAGSAARAGARAAAVGAAPRAAARRAVPRPLRSRVDVADGRVRVAVAGPALLPGLGELWVAASSALDPAGSR